MKYSLWPSPERPWDDIRTLAEYGDHNGWHCLWYADHFMPNTQDGTVIDGPVYECWSILAAVASLTTRIRLGSLVSPTTVRHPAVLANTAATIDRISHGRLVLGIGAGWQVNEHDAYGIDLLSNKERVDRFQEAIQIIASLLRDSRTNFHGQHFQMVDATCQPGPIQNPLPIMVGTGGPRMSKITAQYANAWNTWGNLAEATQRLQTFRDACQQVGRDVEQVHKSVQAMFFLTDSPATVEKLRQIAPSDRSIIGNNEFVIEQLRAYRDLGFDEIIIPDFTLGTDAQARLDAYEKFRHEIIPYV